LPVFGVLNERPHGPCLDTLVPLPELERALRHFLRIEASVTVTLAHLAAIAQPPQ